MANRPRGYGMTGDINRKIAGKYDEELEQQARLWIEDVLEEELMEGADHNAPLGRKVFQECLKSGVLLCRLMNKLQPGSVKKIHDTKMAFKMMENIGSFLDAAVAYGCVKNDLFQTADLYDGTNLGQVVNGIFALGRKAQKNGFPGPQLGVRESSSNPREFTKEQLRAGDTVIGLQMGTTNVANQSGMGGYGNRRQIYQ